MRTIRQILKQEGYEPWSVSAGATVFEALKVMAEKDVGALLVLEDKKLVGSFRNATMPARSS